MNKQSGIAKVREVRPIAAIGPSPRPSGTGSRRAFSVSMRGQRALYIPSQKNLHHFFYERRDN